MKKQILFLSISVLFLTSCSTTEENKNTVKGAGIGAAAGAVLGGVLGHQSGQRNEGAVVGAALGAALGGYAGKRMDKQAAELKKVAETKRTDQGIITQLKSDILFDTGKSDLKPAAKNNLKELADILKKYPENILTVKGYTDSTGSAATNEALSLKRAEAVKYDLVLNGIPADTISVQGLGPANPVGDNKTKEGRSQNRRVEIEITVDESKIPKQKK